MKKSKAINIILSAIIWLVAFMKLLINQMTFGSCVVYALHIAMIWFFFCVVVKLLNRFLSIEMFLQRILVIFGARKIAVRMEEWHIYYGLCFIYQIFLLIATIDYA